MLRVMQTRLEAFFVEVVMVVVGKVAKNSYKKYQ